MPDRSGFLESFSPWPSRSSTPKPSEPNEKPQVGQPPDQPSQPRGNDHSVNNLPRIRLRDYPSDCPKSSVRWFYAVDYPKRKPLTFDLSQTERKSLPAPKKYSPFSKRDSRSIELAFQKLAERESKASQTEIAGNDRQNNPEVDRNASGRHKDPAKVPSLQETTKTKEIVGIKVPVNEDYLFDVDIENRELAPAYWLGPVYDVRRGSWFYQEGSALRPCEENLAGQLEEGYLKVKPWRSPSAAAVPTPVQSKPPLTEIVQEQTKSDEIPPPDTKGEHVEGEQTVPVKFELQTQRLFGAYINSVVTFQDADTAWILSDDLLSRMSSTVYQRFAGGGHLGGTKVLRGYREGSKPKDTAKTDGLPKGTSANQDKESPKASPANSPNVAAKQDDDPEVQNSDSEPRLLKLERQMSNLVSASADDVARREADARQREEDEIKADYINVDGEEPDREIEHLVLVTHGIGQRLGLRMESVNFIHDVNVLRKTLKSVYQNSPDLQALNNDVEKLPKNCRVQVLPVVWRHLLDFPKQSFKHHREQDLTEAEYDEEYPSLDSITVDGVPAIRQLISDLALDILLYQSAYRNHIARIVQQECNRVYDLYTARNPQFNGKVSLIGHSLGSAILFDILCRQRDPIIGQTVGSRPRSHSQRAQNARQDPDLELKFDVEDFYCLGSPLGLYQMLKGHRIRARANRKSFTRVQVSDDPFLGPASTQSRLSTEDLLEPGISSPKCARLFNVFHPADPIAYRVEPLISNAMSSLKPQPLPYTKKGIFGVQGPGFSGIGARVGQSVSGMWSNLTSGVASSLLNRSLGLTGDSQIGSTQPSNSPILQRQREVSLSAGGGTNITAGGVIGELDSSVEHPPTLLDSEKVTLFAEFEKQRKSLQSDGSRDLGERAEWMEAEKRSKKLRAEELKVKALNSNGRVDFSIQEGVFDISLIASIASHLSYWADEDVSHFAISQLLSRQRIIKR